MKIISYKSTEFTECYKINMTLFINSQLYIDPNTNIICTYIVFYIHSLKFLGKPCKVK